MTRYLMAVAFGLSLVVLQMSVVSMAQTKRVPAEPAPVPSPILTARKILVVNGGGEEWSYSDGPFNGGADRAYNQFYAALKGWGRFELVSAPGDADLLFEIQFSVPSVEHQLNMGNVSAISGEQFDPQFQLSIRDARTNALLWRMTEHIQWAILQGNREKNFDQTLAKVVGRVQALVGQSATSASAAKP
jgi:hypothetical protein